MAKKVAAKKAVVKKSKPPVSSMSHAALLGLVHAPKSKAASAKSARSKSAARPSAKRETATKYDQPGAPWWKKVLPAG